MYASLKPHPTYVCLKPTQRLGRYGHVFFIRPSAYPTGAGLAEWTPEDQGFTASVDADEEEEQRRLAARNCRIEASTSKEEYREKHC